MKIPFFDIYIVRGHELRKQQHIVKTQQKIIQTERYEKEALRKRVTLESKMTARQLHQLAVLSGRIRAPLCPRCGKPKIAGGIQWLDHPVGCEKSQEHKHVPSEVEGSQGHKSQAK